MTTQKPVDLTELVKRFDPAAITEQYRVVLGKFKLPNLDTTGLIETQSKNVQVLTDANRAILESTRLLLQRQTEMARQVEEASQSVERTAALLPRGKRLSRIHGSRLLDGLVTVRRLTETKLLFSLLWPNSR